MLWTPGASWSRFPSPLIEADLRISRIRLSGRLAPSSCRGRPSQVYPAQACHAQLAKHQLAAELPRAARGHLLPPPQKSPHSLTHVVVHRPAGHQPGPMRKVTRLAHPHPVQPVWQLPPAPHFSRTQQLAHLPPQPCHALARRRSPKYQWPSLLETMRPERISQKVKPLLGGLHQLRLLPLQGQPGPRHRPRGELEASAAHPRLRITKSPARFTMIARNAPPFPFYLQ